MKPAIRELERLLSPAPAPHGHEDFLQCFWAGTHWLFQLYLARFIQHAVPTVAISQIQSDGQFLLHGKIPALLYRCGERPQVGSLMSADSLEGLGCLADDIRVFAGCGFA